MTINMEVYYWNNDISIAQIDASTKTKVGALQCPILRSQFCCVVFFYCSWASAEESKNIRFSCAEPQKKACWYSMIVTVNGIENISDMSLSEISM